MVSEEARVCKECGNYNPIDTWSCVKCGATLSVDTVTGSNVSRAEEGGRQFAEAHPAGGSAERKGPVEMGGSTIYCPNCRAQNAGASRFCHRCGARLPGADAHIPPPVPQQIYYPAALSDPISQAATIGGISSMAGGALTVLGWLVPWVSIGGLVSTFLSLLDLGSRPGLFNFGLGVGNGLQISLLSLVAGFTALGLSDDAGAFALLALLLLVFAGVLISIPFMAVDIFRIGMKTFEARTYEPEHAGSRSRSIRDLLQSARNRSTSIFLILAALFILAAIIPFGTAVLGGGFYLTALGVAISYAGAFYSQSQLR